MKAGVWSILSGWRCEKWGRRKMVSKSSEKQVGEALKGEGDSRKIDWVRQRDRR